MFRNFLRYSFFNLLRSFFYGFFPDFPKFLPEFSWSFFVEVLWNSTVCSGISLEVLLKFLLEVFPINSSHSSFPILSSEVILHNLLPEVLKRFSRICLAISLDGSPSIEQIFYRDFPQRFFQNFW